MGLLYRHPLFRQVQNQNARLWVYSAPQTRPIAAALTFDALPPATEFRLEPLRRLTRRERSLPHVRM